jgi:uncharacterized protein YidB (DUF937 family)
MGSLSDAIAGALRDHATQQVGATGSSPLAEALRSLLAPRATAAGAPADAVEPEGDALHQLLARFERSGYADIIRSWIGTGANQPIEPHQLAGALGNEHLDDLSDRTGLTREALLGQLARLLPAVIDRLTPQGRLVGVPRS